MLGKIHETALLGLRRFHVHRAEIAVQEIFAQRVHRGKVLVVVGETVEVVEVFRADVQHGVSLEVRLVAEVGQAVGPHGGGEGSVAVDGVVAGGGGDGGVAEGVLFGRRFEDVVPLDLEGGVAGVQVPQVVDKSIHQLVQESVVLVDVISQLITNFFQMLAGGFEGEKGREFFVFCEDSGLDEGPVDEGGEFWSVAPHHHEEEEEELAGPQLVVGLGVVHLADEVFVGFDEFAVLADQGFEGLFEVGVGALEAVVLDDEGLVLAGEGVHGVAEVVDLALDTFEVVGPVAAEFVVAELVDPRFAFDLVEAVHVQLADEGGVVFGFEVFREDFGEALGVGDEEGVAVGAPVDDVAIVFGLIRLPRSCGRWRGGSWPRSF